MKQTVANENITYISFDVRLSTLHCETTNSIYRQCKDEGIEEYIRGVGGASPWCSTGQRWRSRRRRHSSQTEQERAEARPRDAVSHIANSAKQRRGGLYAAGARGGEAGVCWPCLGRVCLLASPVLVGLPRSFFSQAEQPTSVTLSPCPP